MISASSSPIRSLPHWDEILFNDPDCSKAVAAAAGIFFNPQGDQSICRLVSGQLAAGVIYTNWTRESIWAHTAVFADRGVNRDLLWLAFDYPFNQLRVQRIFGSVPETKEEALRVNMKMGFKEVARIEGVFEHGAAAIIMRLDRADAERFLAIKPRGFAKATEH